MTLRELRILIQALPLESAFHRALRGHPWMDGDFMLRELLDETRLHRREYISAHSEKGANIPKFTPSPAPGFKPESEEDRTAKMRTLHKTLVGQLLPGKVG